MPETRAKNKRGSPSTRGGKRKSSSNAKKPKISMPKLPLYSSSSKAKGNFACSKDDILKNVKAIDDADKITPKKLSFSDAEVPTRSFLPCTSLGLEPYAGTRASSVQSVNTKNPPRDVQYFDPAEDRSAVQSEHGRSETAILQVTGRRSPTFDVFDGPSKKASQAIPERKNLLHPNSKSILLEPKVEPTPTVDDPQLDGMVDRNVSVMDGELIDTVEVGNVPCSISVETLNRIVQRPNSFDSSPKKNPTRIRCSPPMTKNSPALQTLNEANMSPDGEQCDLSIVKDEIPSDNEVTDDLILQPCRSPILLDESCASLIFSQDLQCDQGFKRSLQPARSPVLCNIENLENFSPNPLGSRVQEDIDRLTSPDGSQRNLDAADEPFSESKSHFTVGSPKSVSGRKIESDSHNASPKRPISAPSSVSISPIKLEPQILVDASENTEGNQPKNGGPFRTRSARQKLPGITDDLKIDSVSSGQVAAGETISTTAESESISRYRTRSQQLQGIVEKVLDPECEPARSVLEQSLDIGSEFDVEAGEDAVPPSSEKDVITIAKTLSNENIGDGFKSAGGKNIVVSQENLDRVKVLASELFGKCTSAIQASLADQCRTGLSSDGDCKTFVKPQAPTVDTRSYKPPVLAPGSVSNPAEKTSAPIANKTITSAFKSAGGKSVSVSQKSIEKMKALAAEVFGDDVPAAESLAAGSTSCGQIVGQPTVRSYRPPVTDLVPDPKGQKDVRIAHNEGITSAFKSAGGKSVNVSQESINKMKALAAEFFGDDAPAAESFAAGSTSSSQIDGQPTVRSYRPPVTDLVPDPKVQKDVRIAHNEGITSAFKSAGGKSVSVSQKSIDKMKALLSECTDLPMPELPSTLKAQSGRPVQTIPVDQNSSVVELSRGDQKKRANPRRNIQRPSNPLLSPEWEEFPDLPFSQAAILDEFLDRQKPDRISKNAPSNRENLATDLRNVQNKKNPNSKPKQSNPGNMNKRKSPQEPAGNVNKKFRQEISSSALQEALDVKKRLRLQQKEVIDAKANLSTVPVPGLLSRKKIMPDRLTLRDFNEEIKTVSQSNVNKMIVKKSVSQVTSENAVLYRFHSKDQSLESGAKIKDGNVIADSCMIVFADDGTAGLPEISTAFFTSPHVSPDLVPGNWLANHYRWIVWKLACLERVFPEFMYSRCLTLENVLLQMKYRYDREIDLTQRSAFRKILEADAPPNRFVCCVASTKKIDGDGAEEKYELELTDGWYSIWATCDEAMTSLLKRSIVAVGTKMVVHGAEIVNCQQGCNPLEVPSEVRLKISTNSTRRAKWYAKLGFTQQNASMPTLLCSVLPKGGRIGRLSAVVVRKYPPIYLCKDGDGKTVSRSERSLQILNEQRQKNKSDEAELVYSQLWKEFEEQCKPARSNKKVSAAELSTITNPEELYSIVDGMDDEYVQSYLSTEQQKLVAKFKENLTSKIKHKVIEALKRHMNSSESELKVTKLLKVRLLDFITEDQALLTIWRPSEDDMNDLCEHEAYDFYSLDACGTRDKLLQLSNLKLFSHVPNVLIPDVPERFKRKATPISALNSGDFSPTFDEIDLVGIVVFVKKPHGHDSGGVTNVYLTDPDENCMSITFWTSLSVFGCENIVKEGSVIGCSNLQWRPVSNQRSKIPLVFAKEFTAFSLNPKQSHLQEALHITKAKLAGMNVEYLLSSVKASIGQTARINVNSPSPSSSRSRPNLSPAQEKLKLLSRYGGEAPPLSPSLPMTVSSRHVFQEFKSPCTTPRFQRPRRILDDLQSAVGEKDSSN